MMKVIPDTRRAH